MARKKVLLINPPTPDHRKYTRNADCAAESKGNYLWQPYDFLTISGAFRADVDVEFVDYGVAEFVEDEFLNLLSSCNLCVTSTVEVLWDNDLKFVKKIRSLMPMLPILCFGDILIERENAEILLAEVDGIIPNPMSVNLFEITDFTRAEVKIKSTTMGLRTSSTYEKSKKTPQLALQRQPKHEIFLAKKYRWPFATYKKYTTITTNWGCPYSCSYCTATSLPSIYRNFTEIISEMKKIKSLNIKEIYFSDKSFGIPLDNTKNLLNGMIHSQFNFSWSTYMHPNQFTENFLDLMKQAGCHTIIIGIESANFFSLKKYGRIVDENKTRQLILYANKIGVNVCGDFMIGLPGELITDVERTIQLSTELNLDYASFNIVTPLPGTEIKRLALADGRLKLGQHNFDSTGYNNTLDSDTLLKEELLKLRRKAVLKFYLRPKYIFSRLRKIRGYEHILIQAEEMLSLILNMFRY